MNLVDLASSVAPSLCPRFVSHTVSCVQYDYFCRLGIFLVGSCIPPHVLIHTRPLCTCARSIMVGRRNSCNVGDVGCTCSGCGPITARLAEAIVPACTYCTKLYHTPAAITAVYTSHFATIFHCIMKSTDYCLISPLCSRTAMIRVLDSHLTSAGIATCLFCA